MALAQRIVELRTQHLALTQRELAQALDADPVTVSRWERGRVEPSAHFLRKLATLGGKPISWFFNDDEEAA